MAGLRIVWEDRPWPGADLRLVVNGWTFYAMVSASMVDGFTWRVDWSNAAGAKGSESGDVSDRTGDFGTAKAEAEAVIRRIAAIPLIPRSSSYR